MSQKAKKYKMKKQCFTWEIAKLFNPSRSNPMPLESKVLKQMIQEGNRDMFPQLYQDIQIIELKDLDFQAIILNSRGEEDFLCFNSASYKEKESPLILQYYEVL